MDVAAATYNAWTPARTNRQPIPTGLTKKKVAQPQRMSTNCCAL